jgi:hypothetical protein
MSVNLSPVGGAGAQFFDNNGDPLSGGKLYTYAAGTTTPAVTYTSASGATAQPNPILLDAAGRVPGSSEIWLTAGVAYKFVLRTSTDVLLATWDNILGINSLGNASTVAFTGFKGQSGTVQSLAGNTGSDWIGFTQAGTGADPISAQEKMRQIVHVADFGAVGDGSTDDTGAIQTAIDYVHSQGGGTVTFDKRYLIDSGLFVKDYVTLQGPLGLPDELLPANSASYETQSGVLIINSANTITVLDGASIGNCLVVRKGLDLPFTSAINATAGVAAFAGTAFTVGGPGSYFHHLLILGFQYAIYSVGNERVRCEYVQGDCSNGIHVEACYDISYLENCHFWPWTTTHQSWTTNTLLTRSGCAYRFRAGGDWNKLTNCFSYGYSLGIDVDSCNNVTLLNCGTDYAGGLTTANIGTQIKGTSSNTVLIGHQAAAQGTAVEVNTTSGGGGIVTFVGCSFWGNDIHDISIVQGRAIVDSCTFKSSPAGVVALGGTPNGASVINCDFEGVTTPLAFTGNALEKSTFFGNRFFGCVDTQGLRVFADNQPSQRYDSCYNTLGTGPQQIQRASRGSIATPVAVQNGDLLSSIRTDAHDGTGFRNSTLIRAQVDGTVAANSTPGKLIFSTVKIGETSLVDRMVALNDGTWAPVTDDAYTLGNAAFRWSAVWAANGTIQTSDERTKTNIQDSSLGLNFIESLRPVSYKFKVGGQEVIKQVYRNAEGLECAATDDGAKPAEIITNEIAGVRTHWGLIAQEVKTTCDAAGVDFAGWLLTDKENPESQQALRYDQFIAPLIKAVQELSNRVKYLENK